MSFLASLGDLVCQVTAGLGGLSLENVSQDGVYREKLQSIEKVEDRKVALRFFVNFTEECFGHIDPFEVIASFKRKFSKSPTINPFIFKVANAFFETKELGQAKLAILEVRCGPQMTQRDQFLVRLVEAFYAENKYEDALHSISAIKDSDISKQQFVRFSELSLGNFDPLRIACAFHELHCKSPHLNLFIFKLAYTYLEAHELKAARVAITQLGCDREDTHTQKDQFLVALSGACCNAQNHEEALLAISEIRDEATCQAQFFEVTERGLGNFDPLKVIEIMQKRDPKGLFLNRFIFKMADACLKESDYIAARTFISKVATGSLDDIAKRDHFLEGLFEILYGKANYEEACRCISSIKDANRRLKLFVDFSGRYLGAFNPITLIDAFVECHRTSSDLNPFINKVAQAYYQEQNLQAAKDIIVRLGCGTDDDLLVRDTMLLAIAMRWHQQGEYDKSLEVISIIRPWNPLRHDFMCMFSRKYLQDKNWTKALTIIRSIDDSVNSNSLAREALFIELVTACIDEVCWDIAESAIAEIKRDEKRRVTLIYSLVESCLQSGEHKRAFTIMTSFKMPETPEYQLTNSLTFFRVVCAYFKVKDQEAHQCALRYVAAVMEQEFSINGLTRKYGITVTQKNRIRKFSAFLLKDNLDFFIQCFTFEDWIEATEKIAQLVRKEASFEAFEKYFNLEGTPEPKTSHNEFRKNMLGRENLYDILDLPHTATVEEVKKKYKKLVLIYHPDKLIQAQDESPIDFEKRKREAIVKFSAITTAYQYLVN